MDSLGISISSRQGSAVFIRDGRVIATAVEDRLVDPRSEVPFLPVRALGYCLREAKLASLADVQAIGLHSNRSLEWADLLSDSVDHEQSFFENLVGFPGNLKEELQFRLDVRRELNDLEALSPQIQFIDSDQALVRGIYHNQPNPSLGILKLDNWGEETNTSLWSLDPEKRERIWLSDEHQSLLLLARNIAAFCGFRGRLGEKQFLNLASYGEPRFESVIKQLVTVYEDGRFELDLDKIELSPLESTEFSELCELVDDGVRSPDWPITSREIDLSHALVGMLKDVAIKSATTLLQKYKQKNILIRGAGPVADIMRARLVRARRFTISEAVPEADETITFAAGAALEALDNEYGGSSWSSGLRLDLKPTSAFVRFSQLAPAYMAP